jgi:Zn-dependent M28 family amino/carboxypeptidase
MGMSNGYIWNGADDNGSGTVGVMTLAKAIIETGVKPEKTIIIALWTGEEEGFLGSRFYVQNLSFPLENIKLNMNFDMISRYFSAEESKKVLMPYTNSLPLIKEMTTDNLKKYGIDLIFDFQPSSNPIGASDESTFINAGIPIIRIKTAHPQEYHTPDDELSLINWDLMEKIIKISFANIWELANKEW